jgi:hypothetical protein
MWCSFSQSDMDAGLGQVASSKDVIFGDSFSLFLHYEHGGNFRAAIRAVGGRANESEVT